MWIWFLFQSPFVSAEVFETKINAVWKGASHFEPNTCAHSTCRWRRIVSNCVMLSQSLLLRKGKSTPILKWWQMTTSFKDENKLWPDTVWRQFSFNDVYCECEYHPSINNRLSVWIMLQHAVCSLVTSAFYMYLIHKLGATPNSWTFCPTCFASGFCYISSGKLHLTL